MASEIAYEVIRSSRKTLAIEITPDGRVIVRSPQRLSQRQIRAFVEEKTPWIQKHLEKQPTGVTPLTAEERTKLAREAARLLSRQVPELAAVVGVSYGRITVRAQHKRWGSCSSRGDLSFNMLLARMPEEVRGYVVVHELCHRLEMNHSPAFWAQVERVMPNYRSCKKWLKENGPGLLALLGP